MLTEQRTLAEIDFACEALGPLARAERHYDTAGRKPNPFHGNIETLAALERERDVLAARAYIDNLERLNEERLKLRDRIAALGAQHDELANELAEVERDPSVVRFNAGLPIARAAGYGQTFQNYQAWVLSNRSRALRSVTESPVTAYLKGMGGALGASVWPDALLFEDDTERDKLHQWKSLERDVGSAAQGRSDAVGRLNAIERDHPAVQGLD